MPRTRGESSTRAKIPQNFPRLRREIQEVPRTRGESSPISPDCHAGEYLIRTSRFLAAYWTHQPSNIVCSRNSTLVITSPIGLEIADSWLASSPLSIEYRSLVCATPFWGWTSVHPDTGRRILRCPCRSGSTSSTDNNYGIVEQNSAPQAGNFWYSEANVKAKSGFWCAQSQIFVAPQAGGEFTALF